MALMIGRAELQQRDVGIHHGHLACFSMPFYRFAVHGEAIRKCLDRSHGLLVKYASLGTTVRPADARPWLLGAQP